MRSACGRKDFGAVRPRDLNHDMADATGTALNEHALPGLDMRAIHEAFPGRDKDER
jgi:hypothetical protein